MNTKTKPAHSRKLPVVLVSGGAAFTESVYRIGETTIRGVIRGGVNSYASSKNTRHWSVEREGKVIERPRTFARAKEAARKLEGEL